MVVGEHALRQRDPGDHGCPGGTGGRKDVLQRLVPEHVDNQLDAGAAGVADRLKRLVAGLRAHAVGTDPSLVNQVVEQLPRVRGGDDLAGWTVELDQVNGLHTEVAS